MCYSVRLLGVFGSRKLPNKPFQRIAAKDAAPAEWQR